MLKSDLINVVNAQKDYFDSEEYIHRKLEQEVHWNAPPATIISGECDFITKARSEGFKCY